MNSTTAGHPPKPRLALRVGITGHRPGCLSDEAAIKLADCLRQLFVEMRSATGVAHGQYADVFSEDLPRLTVISSLAEGADRIAATTALGLGLELAAPLPFFREEYEKDFKTPESQAEFRALLGRATVFELEGSRIAEDVAYERAGLFMLRQCDVVIAVWNGQPENGRGGTRDILQHALAAGMPVVRFDESGNGPWLLLPAEVGASVDARDLIASARSLDATQLRDLIDSLIAPPQGAQDIAECEGRPRLREFFAERERPTNYWFAYPLFLKVFWGGVRVRRALRPARYIDAADENWRREYWQPIEHGGSGSNNAQAAHRAPGNIAPVLQPRHAWADGLAVYYGQAYRSSYISVFVLGATAVLCALLPIPGGVIARRLEDFGGGESIEVGFELLFALAELIVVSIIVYLVFRGRQKSHHEKWLDYRLLAERLRVIRVLALTGSPMPELRIPQATDGVRSPQSWVTWYVRATLREVGMPAGRGDAAYAQVAQSVLVSAELKCQADFHKAYADRERQIGELLQKIGETFFIVSATFSALGFVYFFTLMLALSFDSAPMLLHLKGFAAGVAMFAAALLPAAGAAFFSLRSHGEFERNASLSEAAYQRLTAILKRVDGETAPTFNSVARATDETANVLTSELSDWRFVFIGKPLTLPG